MSGPGGISSNRPVNTGYTAPTQGAGQAKEAGMDLVQDLVLGGKVRTAQAQPPGKSFTETMSAAFTAMGAAVTSFFKGLGDRMAAIEMPQLPRISLRRQEAAQTNAYNPDDMSPKQRGKAQKAADTRLAVIAQLTMIKADGRPISTNEGLAVILNSGPGSALSKEFDKQVKKEFSTENLNYLRDLHSGIHLDADYVAQMKSNLNTTGRGIAALDSALAALKASGIESLDIRMDTNTLTQSRGNSPIRFEMSGPSSGGELGALGLEMNGLNETQTAALKSLGDALNLFTKGIVDNFKDTIPRFVKELKAEANKPDPNVIRADQEGQVSMTRAAENDQAEIGQLKAMSTSEFAQALKADPSLARHLTPDFMNSRVAGRDMAGARFVPQNESSVDPQTFGGAMSTLSKITYKDGTVGMFKGDEGKGVITHNASITAGIPAEIAAANLSARAVATSRLDGALGLDLVPPTEFAVHDGRSGTLQEFAKGQTLMTETRTRIPVSDLTGVTMFLNGRPLPEAQEPAEFDFNDYLSLFDRATANEDLGFGSTLAGPDFLALKEALGKAAAGLNEGIPPDPSMTQQVKALVEAGAIFFTKLQRTSNELALDSPSVQQSMSNAHVMDLLCGQLDRNPGNFIFVNAGDGGLQVKLIDNDLSFGNKFTSLSESSMNKIGSQMLPTSLPRLIDAGTAARVLAMTPDALRAELADTGLGDDEMNAAASRLGQLQGHILDIQAGVVPGGQLVNDWNAQTYQSLMQAPDNYVQRSMENINAAKGAAPGA